MQHIPPDRSVEAATYRNLLKMLPEQQVRQTFHDRLRELNSEATAAIEDRESVLFFNQPAAVANYDYWSKAQIWSLEDAVALKFGRDPTVVNWAAFEREHATATPFAASYRQVAELIHRAVQAGKLSEPIEPKLFLEWCRKISLPVPPSLVRAVEAMRGRLVDWQAAYQRLFGMYQGNQRDLQAWSDAYEDEVADHAATQKQLLSLSSFAAQTLQELYAERSEHAQEIEALKVEQTSGAIKELKAQERESLLKIVIGMAVEGYRYDPSAKRSDRVPEIVADLERAGVAVSDETVRKYLRQANKYLSPEAKAGVG